MSGRGPMVDLEHAVLGPRGTAVPVITTLSGSSTPIGPLVTGLHEIVAVGAAVVHWTQGESNSVAATNTSRALLGNSVGLVAISPGSEYLALNSTSSVVYVQLL